MIDVRPYGSLGAFRNDWLDSRHHTKRRSNRLTWGANRQALIMSSLPLPVLCRGFRGLSPFSMCGNDDRVYSHAVGPCSPVPRSLILEGIGLRKGGIHLFGTALQPRRSTITTRLDPADRSMTDPRIGASVCRLTP